MGFLTGALAQVANLEGGFAHTARELCMHPGAVVRGYVAGKTVPYTHPVAYFTVGTGLFALVSNIVAGPTGAGGGDRLFLLAIVPCITAALRLTFWSRGFNYAEHLIAVLYLSGQVTLGLAMLYVGVPLAGRANAAAYGFACLASAIVYFVWAYSQVFVQRRWVAAAGVLVSLIGGTLMWFGAVWGLVSIFRT